MDYRRLGRTGLSVSILSLGSGGPNQFGQLRYRSRGEIDRLVRRALDFGVNYFDTAAGYAESERRLAETLRGVPRGRYFLSSKIAPTGSASVLAPAEARRLVERSLRRLNVEALDLLFLHKVRPQAYVETRDRLLPLLHELRAEGKVRFIGISESSKFDPGHETLERALADDEFDAVMTAFSLGLDPVAERILARAQARDVGVVGMAAARHLVSRNPGQRLRLFAGAVGSLVASPPERGRVFSRLRNALGSLRRNGPSRPFVLERQGGEGALSLPAAAYRYALSRPGVATVLTGTTDCAHLEENLRACLGPALEPEEVEVLRRRAGA
jgi:aryl-alcohol dehydrogenase-like predicted oxidoreductase